MTISRERLEVHLTYAWDKFVKTFGEKPDRILASKELYDKAPGMVQSITGICCLESAVHLASGSSSYHFWYRCTENNVINGEIHVLYSEDMLDPYYPTSAKEIFGLIV